MQFAICLKDEGYEASLEAGKLYRVVPDDQGGHPDYIRVIDESGEDYAYATNRFYLIELPLMVEKALLSALNA